MGIPIFEQNHMSLVKTWYTFYGHPAQNGNPYAGYINPYDNEEHPLKIGCIHFLIK